MLTAITGGICLAPSDQMNAAKRVCEHCEGILLNNKAYRVRSEDHGLRLLDMIVCYACHLEARNLGLQTEEMRTSPRARQEEFVKNYLGKE